MAEEHEARRIYRELIAGPRRELAQKLVNLHKRRAQSTFVDKYVNDWRRSRRHVLSALPTSVLMSWFHHWIPTGGEAPFHPFLLELDSRGVEIATRVLHALVSIREVDGVERFLENVVDRLCIELDDDSTKIYWKFLDLHLVFRTQRFPIKVEARDALERVLQWPVTWQWLAYDTLFDSKGFLLRDTVGEEAVREALFHLLNRLASEENDGGAYFSLGYFYRHCRAPDLKKARAFYLQGALLGNILCQREAIGYLVEERRFVEAAVYFGRDMWGFPTIPRDDSWIRPFVQRFKDGQGDSECLQLVFALGREMEGMQQDLYDWTSVCVEFYLDISHRARTAALQSFLLDLPREIICIVAQKVYASRLADVQLWNATPKVPRKRATILVSFIIP